mgnify:CR=1 FL=1
MIRPLALCGVLALAACGGDGTTPALSEAQSAALLPGDAGLAEIYNRSCRSCHILAATGAPLTGDAAAWEPRLAKGMDAMLDSVFNGSGGMPPLGLCMDCSAEQCEALIRFMASPP